MYKLQICVHWWIKVRERLPETQYSSFYASFLTWRLVNYRILCCCLRNFSTKTKTASMLCYGFFIYSPGHAVFPNTRSDTNSRLHNNFAAKGISVVGDRIGKISSLFAVEACLILHFKHVQLLQIFAWLARAKT